MPDLRLLRGFSNTCLCIYASVALIALLDESEDLDHLMSMSPEDLLLRWVNYHLKAASWEPIRNFSDDIKVVYKLHHRRHHYQLLLKIELTSLH